MLLSNTSSPKRSIVILHKRASAESQPPSTTPAYNRPFSPPRMLPSLGTPPLAPNKGVRTNSQTPKKITTELPIPQKQIPFGIADQFKSVTSPSGKKLSPLNPEGRKPPSSNSLLTAPLETSDVLNFTTISSLGERDSSQV